MLSPDGFAGACVFALVVNGCGWYLTAVVVRQENIFDSTVDLSLIVFFFDSDLFALLGGCLTKHSAERRGVSLGSTIPRCDHERAGAEQGE